jgi:hypothetical protein
METLQLPDPRLALVYRLEATVGEPVELGETAAGQRRIVPLTGGTFTGPVLTGRLLPGSSADWQTVRPDGTAFGDIRYTLQTDAGDVLYVQSRGVRQAAQRFWPGSVEVKTSIRASTRFAPRQRSRRLPRNSIGSTRACS